LLSVLNMNLLAKLSVVPIFFVPLIAGWAGTQEEANVVEQPPVKTTEPLQITVGGPLWLVVGNKIVASNPGITLLQAADGFVNLAAPDDGRWAARRAGF
jgi:hypothetical protein